MAKKKVSKKASKKTNPKNPVGRPTKYKKDYCEGIVNFFNRPYEMEKIKHIPSKSGDVIEVPDTEACDFPTFERYAANIEVNTDTLLEWCDKHDEFSAAYKKAKSIQKDILFNNAMKGKYQSNFAIFFAKCNLGMKENEPADEKEIHIHL